jgi:nicotinamide riboside transporter PnuC
MTLHTAAIEVIAAVFGVWGTALLALRGPRAGWGFVAYLVSNVAWLVFAWAYGHWGMFAQTLAFMASSLFGIWVWLLRPALDAVDQVFDL